MIINQARQLKLNVTNINSFLIKKNSESRSLRLQKRNFLLTQEKQEETKKKEKKIESSAIKTTLNKITSAILSGPMSLFDKIMNFAGTILLGILINNLPAIIEKVEKFFADNKWLVDGIRFLFDVTGKAIQSVIGFITNFKSFVGSTQEQIKIQRDNITKEIENFNIMVGSMDVSLLSLIQDLGKKPTNQGPQPTPRQTPFQRTAGYGRYSAPSQQTSIPTSPTPVSPAAPSTPPAAAPKPRGYAKGGEVTRGSQVQQGRVSAPKIRSSTFTQGETGRAKAARQSVNYFESFKFFSNSFESIVELDEENNKKFEELAMNIKSLPSLFGEDKNNNKTRRSPGTSGDLGDGSISIVPGKEVVGYVGSTGRSTGPHIHIETGDGYGGAGGNIPKKVLDNIIVGSKSLSSVPQGDGLGSGRNHRGFDYALPSGTPIQLQGGLKFVQYDAMTSQDSNAGYGNVLIIQDESGQKYLLGHLNSGPANPEQIKKLQEKQTKTKSQYKSSEVTPTGSLQGEISWYGPGFYNNKTADGTKYTPQSFLAAHKSLPFGTLLRITWKGRSIVVPVKDRGPYISGRVVDLSNAAAEALGMKGTGVIPSGDAKIEVVKPAVKKQTPPPAPSLPPVDQQTSLNIEEQSGENIVLLATQKHYIPFPVSVPTPVVVTKNGRTTGSIPLSDIWTS